MAPRHNEFFALVQCLRGTVPHDVDWEKLLSLANRTLVTPALAETLRDRPHVPSDVGSFLKEVENRSRRRNGLLRRQLEEALACLNAAGLQPILLKGAALLATARDGEFGRILSDLDLLLPEDSMSRAVAALGELGYGYRDEVPNAWDVHALGRPSDPGMLDLHTCIKIARPLIDYACLARQGREVTVGRARALVPSPEYQALVLIMHDQVQEHDYVQGNIDLRHLVDLAWLDRHHRPDWALLPVLAEGRHGRSAVGVQLRCLRNILGVCLPPRTAGSFWSGLQYRRRLLQLRFPIIAPLATLLTLLFDPPLNPPMTARSKRLEGHVRMPFWRISRLIELGACHALPTKV